MEMEPITPAKMANTAAAATHVIRRKRASPRPDRRMAEALSWTANGSVNAGTAMNKGLKVHRRIGAITRPNPLGAAGAISTG